MTVIDDVKNKRDYWLTQKAALTGSHQEEINFHTVERDGLDVMITELQKKPQTTERDDAIDVLVVRRGREQDVLDQFAQIQPLELASVQKEVDDLEKVVIEIEK